MTRLGPADYRADLRDRGDYAWTLSIDAGQDAVAEEAAEHLQALDGGMGVQRLVPSALTGI